MTSEILYVLDPCLFAKEQLGFIADPWQAVFLRSSRNLQILHPDKVERQQSAQ